MMLPRFPAGLDLRGPLEKRAHINSMHRRLNAFRYMRANRVVMFIVGGGM